MKDPIDNITLPLAVTAPMRLQLDTPARFIDAELTQDLLGHWIVTQWWTSKSNGRNGRKSFPVADQEAGLAVLDQLVRQHP